MSIQMPEPKKLHSLLSDLRNDFDAFRQRAQPIQLRLLHIATNAKAEGVDGNPTHGKEAAAILTAGNRNAIQFLDKDRKPVVSRTPPLNLEGNPSVNSEGLGLAMLFPASRRVEIVGNADDVRRLRALVSRGGRLADASGMRASPILSGWRFGNDEAFWWSLMFELAWSRRTPTLTAEHRLWVKTDDGNICFVPHDREKLRGLAGLAVNVPERWFHRLPDAFVSDIEDAASAYLDVTLAILDELRSTVDVAREVASRFDGLADYIRAHIGNFNGVRFTDDEGQGYGFDKAELIAELSKAAAGWLRVRGVLPTVVRNRLDSLFITQQFGPTVHLRIKDGPICYSASKIKPFIETLTSASGRLRRFADEPSGKQVQPRKSKAKKVCRKRTERTEPTARQAEAWAAYQRTRSYRATAQALGIRSESAAYKLVKKAEALMNKKGRSVSTQSIPLDLRGQEMVAGD